MVNLSQTTVFVSLLSGIHQICIPAFSFYPCRVVHTVLARLLHKNIVLYMTNNKKHVIKNEKLNYC